MVRVTPGLVSRKVNESPLLGKAFSFLENDHRVRAYLRMANVNAVSRLGYNDHGVVHSRIVSGSALEILDILHDAGVEPSIVKDGIGDFEDARLAVLMGAYLHDIGNSVHRDLHNVHGIIIADSILTDFLKTVYDDYKAFSIKQEILHIIFSHDESVTSLSIESGVVKVADGTDMAEGRARIPYRTGKLDIHAFSALAIKEVQVTQGKERPVGIEVRMENEAGVFQVEMVLGRKIKSSSIAKYVEVRAYKGSDLLKVFLP